MDTLITVLFPRLAVCTVRFIQQTTAFVDHKCLRSAIASRKAMLDGWIGDESATGEWPSRREVAVGGQPYTMHLSRYRFFAKGLHQETTSTLFSVLIFRQLSTLNSG